MKKVLFLLVAGLLIASSVSADETNSAVATVVATVNPNVSVGTITSVVNPPTGIQTGDFCADIIFRVDANTQMVQLCVDASGLWKGDDPLGTEVLPIPVNLSAGAVITPTNANPIDGGTNVAQFNGSPTTIGNYPASASECITFESSQNNHFSQDVTVRVCYTQDDPEKPTGQYSGKVRLTAAVVP